MDITALRAVLGPALVSFARTLTHDRLTVACKDLGLQPTARDSASLGGRMEAAWKSVEDKDVVTLARHFLERHCKEAKTRNALEDVLSAALPTAPFHKRLRHELAAALEDRPLYRESGLFRALLERFWILDSPTEGLARHSGKTLGDEIDRHIFRNDDWNPAQLFDKLGAFDAPDWRFGRFLEGMASGDIWRSVPDQQAFVAAVNAVLIPAGSELRETDPKDGYPAFAVVSRLVGHRSRVKNLIFASQMKPDLRLSDTVSNDIEILSHEDDVLVYDRPVGEQGLSWKDLETWWMAAHPTSNRSALYRRLLKSLPENSPPQKVLFDTYYRLGRRYPVLPVLLPEVWLHWDPKAVRDRGFEAMTRFRMDFLLLLPGNRRVVIEVDGIRHYTDKNGQASPKVYAKMVAADRDLKLAGYEVFRFGGAELTEDGAPQIVTAFFESLFKQSGIAADS